MSHDPPSPSADRGPDQPLLSSSFALEHAPWADLVFHVLAHAERTAALASSLVSPAYVAHAARILGPASGRALGADAALLGELLATHEQLAMVQGLAWLFDGIELARASADRDLAALSANDVSSGALLALLRDAGPAVELLRCAALLEAEAFARLPAPELDRAALASALSVTQTAAPSLARHRVGICRALHQRGRVFGPSLLVGAPVPGSGPEIEHFAWQAAHEATVAEVQRAARAGPHVGERAIEHAALVLLGRRARRVRLGDAHARWIAHLAPGARQLEHSPLPPELDELVARLLGR